MPHREGPEEPHKSESLFDENDTGVFVFRENGNAEPDENTYTRKDMELILAQEVRPLLAPCSDGLDLLLQEDHADGRRERA